MSSIFCRYLAHYSLLKVVNIMETYFSAIPNNVDRRFVPDRSVVICTHSAVEPKRSVTDNLNQPLEPFVVQLELIIYLNTGNSRQFIQCSTDVV